MEVASNYIVISLGGSLIAPEGIDAVFISSFKKFIEAHVARGQKFAIITGGGKTSRHYTDALKMITDATSAELDWLGISVTRLNAELLRFSFNDQAEPVIFLDPTAPVLTGKPILVGGGWKPGHSSDGSAVALAKSLGAKKLINLTNIDHVYTDDPRKNPDATAIEKISWTDFRNLLPAEWDPGINAPFDPVAAGMAQDLGLEVVVLNGKNLANLGKYLEGQAFVGTVIK